VPTPSLYTREKNPTGVWRYKRVEEGRGVKTGDVAAPFFTRPSVHGRQLGKTLSATTFQQAKEEVAQWTAALHAQAKGLAVEEADAVTNATAVLMGIRFAIPTWSRRVSSCNFKRDVACPRRAEQHIDILALLAKAGMRNGDPEPRSV
jgi:hypothetical protein